MEYSIGFNAVKLNEALADITGMHLTIEEKAYKNNDAEVSELIRQLKFMSEDQVREYVFAIRNSSLELLLPALRKEIDDSIKDKLIFILKHRAKKRLFNLCWIMLQNDYRNLNLLEAMKILCTYMRINFKSEYGQTLFKRLPVESEDLLKQALEILVEEGGAIGEVFKKYRIHFKSPLGMDLCVLFFTKCSSEGFLNNKKKLFDVVSECEDRVIPIAVNYLEKLDILDYMGNVNMLLLKNFGEPNSESSLWKNIKDESKYKFSQWIRIKDMEEHFGEDLKRYQLWLRYYKDIKGIRREKKDYLLFIDFGGFVVVDLGGKQHETYLYRRKIFEVKYEQYMIEKEYGAVGWPVSEEEMMSARNAFLEDLNAESYLMSYSGVGILYIKEIMKRELERSKGI